MRSVVFIFLLFLSSTLYSQSEPSWIKNFPYSPDYYTGIGSSNSGNKSNDYTRALERARMNLASEISTSISSETTFESSDSTDQGLKETFTEKMKQIVDQNLREVEVVDTWYSSAQGYWVYVRLNKSRWMEIRKKESDNLLSRIEGILNDKYFSKTVTTSEKLHLLGAAASLLEDSPYRDILSGTIGGLYTGNILDFISGETYRLLSSISMEIIPSSTEMELNGAVSLNIRCMGSDNYTGKLPLILNGESGNIRSLVTDINGSLRFNADRTFLIQGENRVKLTMDPVKLGFPQTELYKNIFSATSAQRLITVRSSSIFLRVISNRTSFSDQGNQISSILTENNPDFQITEDQKSAAYFIDFNLTFSDYPRVLENAPLMAGLSASLKLRQGNRVLFQYNTETFKDGGLTYSQAYNRVFTKMIKRLSELPEIQDKISEAMKE